MTNALLWDLLGFLGQGVFTARFVVQWLASEKKRDSVVPTAFWWLSLMGGILVLIYAIHIRSKVFIVGQGLGIFVYVRNLTLVGRRARCPSVGGENAVPSPHVVLGKKVAGEKG